MTITELIERLKSIKATYGGKVEVRKFNIPNKGGLVSTVEHVNVRHSPHRTAMTVEF